MAFHLRYCCTTMSHNLCYILHRCWSLINPKVLLLFISKIKLITWQHSSHKKHWKPEYARYPSNRIFLVWRSINDRKKWHGANLYIEVPHLVSQTGKALLITMYIHGPKFQMWHEETACTQDWEVQKEFRRSYEETFFKYGVFSKHKWMEETQQEGSCNEHHFGFYRMHYILYHKFKE